MSLRDRPGAADAGTQALGLADRMPRKLGGPQNTHDQRVAVSEHSAGMCGRTTSRRRRRLSKKSMRS